MATSFTGTYGNEWTYVGLQDPGAVLLTNFDGNVIPGAGTDVVVSHSDVIISKSHFTHNDIESAPVAVRDLSITIGGVVTADASLMTIHGTLMNNGAFNIVTDTVKVLGGIVNGYLLTINGQSGSAHLLMDSGDFTLSGDGDLRLTSNVDGTAYLTGRDGELTIFHNEGRISGTGYIGWSGQIHYPGGYVSIKNSGIIDANVSGRTLQIVQGTSDVNPLENSGTLMASAGGRLQIDDALLLQSGVGKIGAYGSGSVVALNGVSVRGGYLDTSGGGLIYLAGATRAAELDGSTAAGKVTITLGSLLRIGLAGHVGADASIKGNIVNYGEIGVLGYWSSLVVSSSATLTGGGTIHLSYAAGAGGNTGDAFLRGASDTELSTLVNVDNHIHGAGHIGRYGYTGYSEKQLAVVNGADGVIEADNADAPLVINRTVSFANEGLLRASNGADLMIGGNIGTMAEMTVIDNEGGRIVASGEGSEVVVRGGAIRGGTLDTDDGGVIRLVNYSYSILDGSTSQGAVTNEGVVRVDDGFFRGDIVNDHRIVLDRGAGSRLQIAQEGVTLSGDGILNMVGDAVLTGSSQTENAELVNRSTIEGEGFIGGYSGYQHLLTLDNRAGGLIRATAGDTLVLDTAGTIRNTGVLEANGGTLDIRDLISGTGTVRATNGGTLLVRGDWTGTVTFSGGGQETVSYSGYSGWEAGRTLALKGFGTGDRLDLGYVDSLSLSSPDTFAWKQSGSDGTFTLTGFSGTRAFVFSGLTQTHLEVVSNGSGGYALVRRATIEGNNGNNTLDGTAGKDRMIGYAGADTFRATAGDDIFDGGAGSDTVDYAAATGRVTVDLSTSSGQAVGGGQGTDLFRFIENVAGGRFDDSLAGDAAANVLSGKAGADTLRGRAGNDMLDGGTGADRMEGGIGDDVYIVDNSGDRVVELAREGTDTVRASVSVALSANVEHLVLTGTSSLAGTGNALDNRITGNAGANVLKGGAGNDTLDGAAGGDRLEGGAGNDTYVVDNRGDRVVELAREGTDTVRASVSLTLSANVEHLLLTGSADLAGTGNGLANALTGNTGRNTLKGGGGNDVLTGGGGADSLHGGSGADRFVFLSTRDSTTGASGRDKIFDFSRSQRDKIDLKAIDASTRSGGDQKFKFIGDDAFHKKAGELRYEHRSGDTLVHGDTDGNGRADFTIILDAVINLRGSDFIL